MTVEEQLRIAKHRAWVEGVQACIDVVKRRHAHYELYRCDCGLFGPHAGERTVHADNCKAVMMSTHPATFAILDEVFTFLSALLKRGPR